MIIEHIVLGMLHTNCWILGDDRTRECVLFDPGTNFEKITAFLEEKQLTVKVILLTHGHFDHVMAARLLQDHTGAQVMICRPDELILSPDQVLHRGYMRQEYQPPRIDRLLYDGDTFSCGGLQLKVMRTPGHTAGSCCVLCGDVMVSGDTLFEGCCGRWDLGGDEREMMISLRRLYELPGDYKVLPGHGPATTLEKERKLNAYMKMAVGR
jgi:glyoxylase-like metal-dependent hydrolase (beta-lactamase superfamily II)